MLGQHQEQQYRPTFGQTSPYLIFGADETMLETLWGTKILVLEDVTEVLAAEVESFPHMSCHSIFGEVMPPYMIIPSIRTLPPELKIFLDSGLIDVAFAPSGYMNKDAFLFWTLTFINRLSVYQLELSEAIRNSRAVLILDGHSSKACSIALWLLDKAKSHYVIQ